LPEAEVAKHVEWQYKRLGFDYTNGPSLERLVTVQRDRVKTTLEMVQRSHYFYTDSVTLDPEAASKQLTSAIKEPLTSLLHSLTALTTWTAVELHQLVADTATKFNIGMGKIAQPLRVAVTGNTVSPSIDVTMELVGQVRTVKRIQAALEFIKD